MQSMHNLVGTLRNLIRVHEAMTQSRIKTVICMRNFETSVCTWERFERAVGRAGADVGVGGDGYSGYLTRKAALSVRRIYYRLGFWGGCFVVGCSWVRQL